MSFSIERDLSDIEVLALTIYGEARGESIEGQIAVGCVIRNRAIAGSTYKDICLEPNQFSCWNHDDPNYPILTDLALKLFKGETQDELVLMQCMWTAEGIMNHEIIDITKGAKNYMTNKLYEMNKPNWSKSLKVSIVIGNQTFLV